MRPARIRLILALCATLLVSACSEDLTGAAVPTPLPVVAGEVPIVTSAPTPTLIPLPVRIVDYTKTVSPGDQASIAVRTSSGAKCTISVLYESGESEAKGLDEKTADSSGDVTWAWSVGHNTNPQTALVTVTCESMSQTGVLMIDLAVR